MPSHHARRVYDDVLPYLTEEMLLVSATKGMENGTLLRMSQVINDVVGNRFPPRTGVLSGPTFARRLCARAGAVVIASARYRPGAGCPGGVCGPGAALYPTATRWAWSWGPR